MGGQTWRDELPPTPGFSVGLSFSPVDQGNTRLHTNISALRSEPHTNPLRCLATQSTTNQPTCFQWTFHGICDIVVKRLPDSWDENQFCLINLFLNLPFFNSLKRSNFLSVHDMKECKDRRGFFNSLKRSNFLPVHDMKECKGRRGIAPPQH